MKSINDSVKSKGFATWLALLSMVIQAKHTFTAYMSTESIDPSYVDIMFSVLAAAVFDMIILFYTLRGRIDVAKFGAYMLAIINIYAYWIEHQAFTLAFAFGIVFGCAMPALVFYYSDELIDNRTRKKNQS